MEDPQQQQQQQQQEDQQQQEEPQPDFTFDAHVQEVIKLKSFPRKKEPKLFTDAVVPADVLAKKGLSGGGRTVMTEEDVWIDEKLLAIPDPGHRIRAMLGVMLSLDISEYNLRRVLKQVAIDLLMYASDTPLHTFKSPVDESLSVSFTHHHLALLAVEEGDGPLIISAGVVLEMAQAGVTHIAMFAKDTVTPTPEPVSTVAYMRSLLRDARTAKRNAAAHKSAKSLAAAAAHARSRSVFAATQPDAQRECVGRLVEALGMFQAPVHEAIESIGCLREEIDPTVGLYHADREVMGLAWTSLGALMAPLPQEGEPARSAEEQLRPIFIQCPRTGLVVNRGDVYARAAELSAGATEAEEAAKDAGVLKGDFCSLGYPQLVEPIVGGPGSSTAATVLAMAGLAAAVAAVRYVVLVRGKE